MGGIVAGAMFLLSVLTPISKSSHHETAHISPSKAPTPTPTQIPKPTEKIYKVESGDTLFTIAEEKLGGQKYWINLWNHNDWIEDPRLIRSGWELKIPISKPTDVEKPLEKLSTIYKEITDPSPTPSPEPIKEVAGATAPAGSFENVYKDAGSKYGVPWEILYGLHLTETGLRDGAISSGYGTGAQGPMQFMPGTWSRYGVDGNGDGISDINNASDAIYGAANYLAAHGGVDLGLKSYGGDTQSILNAARSRGWSQ
jgi:LysM repeat protein